MEDKEFKHFFDAGLGWARKHMAEGVFVPDLRGIVMADVRREKGGKAVPFAAGALYGLAEQEVKDDRQQAR